MSFSTLYHHLADSTIKRKDGYLTVSAAKTQETAFCSGKGAEPDALMSKTQEAAMQRASDVDTLMRLLGKPETADFLKQLVKAMDK